MSIDLGDCSTTTTSSSEKTKREKAPYRGIRMRKWGKWVAEIREPNKRSRIWLGSYATPVAAARAYDTAVFYLRGPTARLNFPADLVQHDLDLNISAASIRKKATEVGARVDALATKTNYFINKPDLNQFPTNSDDHEPGLIQEQDQMIN